MRTAIVGAALLLAGGVAIVTGVLPGAEVAGLWDRVWPILLFVVAITVVTELAAAAGLFTVIARRTARWGRGRAWLLWLLVALLSTLSTIFLSLDTTAVLLTPIVIVMARHAGLDPLPFALTIVWLANTGSLLLPVSNLTNLLAQHAMGEPSPLAFAALTAAPAVVAILVPLGAIWLLHRRRLRGSYEVEAATEVDDRILLRWSAAVVAALVPLLVSGLLVWIPASAAAAVLLVVFAIRRRGVLRLGLLPWQLVLLAAGLFLSIQALHALGAGALLAAIAGSGESLPDLLRLSLTGMIGANAIDNLPAYLALEPAADTPVRLVALLIGVNAGPLITPWASLATLLWHQRLVAEGVRISWGRYALLGVVVAPVTVVLATVALAAVA